MLLGHQEKAGCGWEELSTWTKAVVNHMYWSARTSPEDLDLILPKWKSLVAHVTDVHSHRDPLFPECQHQELHKKWLEEGSPAHQKLRELVLFPHLLRDIPRLSSSAQTFATECFHNTLLQFAPKLMHYIFRSMKARQHRSRKPCLFIRNLVYDERVVLALDMKGALDNISHTLVFEDLASTGCGPRMYDYVRDFLSNCMATI
ncbi:hypothetical protein HPB47_026170 [Ixodes persulcatus]|uniref:Uncharacterized protein n=1 Tax=Ixodes persulcatus TaxID=34615 RepID=A0AC60Q1B8_IXOPE|nr:hypothetical protein HPB47_026170 [Ixodes persulcatus]